MEPNPAGAWQFVNIIEPKKQKKDEDIRKMVRANAMRDFRKKQKQEREASSKGKGKAAANEGRPLRRVNLSIESSTSPEPAAKHQKLEYQVKREHADSIWPKELGRLLGNLDILSIGQAKEHAVKAEEELARQVDEQSAILPEGPTLSAWVHDEETGFGQPLTRRRPIMGPQTVLDAGNIDQFSSMPGSSLPGAGTPRYNALIIHHFATVMASNCLPVDPGAGENPLTKIWLPYALQDTTLFLATLTFSAVHLDILAGRKKNPKVYMHKSDTIQAINEAIQSPKDAYSNSTIAAVAMVAASESIQGNFQELQIHMKALARMVDVRGGLQKLGWSGVLHMFISWQDLLFSSILAQPPVYSMTPCCLLIRDSLPGNEGAHPEMGMDPGMSRELRSLFDDLGSLTDSLNSHVVNKGNSAKATSFATTLDLMSFSKTRTAVEHRILNAARSDRKPRQDMTEDDYNLESCRVAALIYIKCALHMFLPVCQILVSLKTELVRVAKDAEKHLLIGVRERIQPMACTWGLMVGSLLSATPEEEEWFAMRIAKGARTIDSTNWADMEARLKRIAWVDKLRTGVCRSVWARVQLIMLEE